MQKTSQLLFFVKKQTLLFLRDAFIFLTFFTQYVLRKIFLGGAHFEGFKRIVVVGLISKRGRFTRPFLHFGVGTFFAFGVIAAPVVATTYPLFSENTQLAQAQSPSSALISLDSSSPVLSTEISPKPRDTVIVYKVEPGDTLSSIAAKFDISVDTILWENNLDSKTTLSIGQKLRISPVSGVAHKVLKGDTIYSIAKYYDTDAQKIVNFPFNDFADPDTFTLTLGQILIVPDGTPPAVVPITPKRLPRFIAQSEIVAGTEGFIWPTSGNISQNPVWYHMAVDIANREGPLVAATKDGTVAYTGCVRGGYGCHVIVDHGDGITTVYGHLSQISVLDGSDVAQGQVVGKMGNTGRSSGTHLHFEVRKNGVLLNPLNFLK